MHEYFHLYTATYKKWGKFKLLFSFVFKVSISLLTEINTTTSSNKGLIFKIFYDIKIAFNTLIAAFVIHLVLVSGG